MAPQNKRAAASAKVPVANKKVKTAPAPEPEDPLSIQLNPIISALETSELPADCCDIFRAALPHCIADAKGDRHSFQVKMLDLATDAIKRLEEAGRQALLDSETKANNLRAEGAVATADFEAAKNLATAKQEECNAKNTEVERLRGEENAAKAELAEAVKSKEAFAVEKEQFVVDKEAFQKVMEEMWQPLKTGGFVAKEWRKRDKVLAELIEKLKPLSLDESLVEALTVALKLRVDKFTPFAHKAFESAEEAFEKHKTSLAARVDGTAAEEEDRAKAVVEAEVKVADIHGKFMEKDKEYDELQNSWAELETNSNKAQSSVTSFEASIQAALEDVVTRQSDLDAALAVAAAFAALQDPPPAAEPPAPPAEEMAVEAVVEPAVNMEVAVEAVAVAAC